MGRRETSRQCRCRWHRRRRDVRRHDPYRAKALELAQRSGLEPVRADLDLATKLEGGGPGDDPRPLLAEARRRGWPDGGLRLLPEDHPGRRYGGTVWQDEADQVRSEAAEARRVRERQAEGARKTNAKRTGRDGAAERRLRHTVQSLAADGRSIRKTVEILHERGIPVGRAKVAKIRRS